jgi:hypothetical protein
VAHSCRGLGRQGRERGRFWAARPLTSAAKCCDSYTRDKGTEYATSLSYFRMQPVRRYCGGGAVPRRCRCCVDVSPNSYALQGRRVHSRRERVSRQVSGPHCILPSAEPGTTFGALNIWVGKARLTVAICLYHDPSGRGEMKQLYTCPSA